jgi:hypothetical protein
MTMLSRLNSESACYHSFQNLVPFAFIHKNIKFKIYKIDFTSVERKSSLYSLVRMLIVSQSLFGNGDKENFLSLAGFEHHLCSPLQVTLLTGLSQIMSFSDSIYIYVPCRMYH